MPGDWLKGQGTLQLQDGVHGALALGAGFNLAATWAVCSWVSLSQTVLQRSMYSASVKFNMKLLMLS